VALRVQAEFPFAELSKITASEAEGTEALSLVFDADPKFVFPVAFQFADAPPPTQYLDGLCTSISLM
jgi:hypothetical protein